MTEFILITIIVVGALYYEINWARQAERIRQLEHQLREANFTLKNNIHSNN